MGWSTRPAGPGALLPGSARTQRSEADPMSIPPAIIDPPRVSDRVERTLHTLLKSRYQYKPADDNKLKPVCVADSYPFLLEGQDAAWITRFLPGSVRAWSNYLLKRLRFLGQRATFSFDQMAAYTQMFYGGVPEFAQLY